GWERRTFKLDANHKWTAKPGCQVFVADWGAVRFDVPRGWVPIAAATSIKICNKVPPADDCTLEVSVTHLPPIDWSGMPLGWMLREAAGRERRGPVIWNGDLVEEKRGDLEIAWKPSRWLDPKERREACSYICLARRKHTQILLTYDYWLDDEEQFSQVWPDVLETLRVGEQPPGLGRAGG
ncbi:MAG: hypothetical protein AB7K36_32185, partial [Chloroflexota bacterium]